MPCSNAGKTRKPFKFAEVPQITGPISASSRPKFTILSEHVKDILLLNKIFPIVDMCLSCEDIARQSCAMVPIWRFFGDFLRPVFSASPVQHVSDLHLKFALRPHHVWKKSSCGFFFFLSFFFFSSPNLSRRRLDVCHTSTHDVALVRI